MEQETITQVLLYMGECVEGESFTTQELAEFCLHDPYRAGELRDHVLPLLVTAGLVSFYPANENDNYARYILTPAGHEEAERVSNFA